MKVSFCEQSNPFMRGSHTRNITKVPLLQPAFTTATYSTIMRQIS